MLQSLSKICLNLCTMETMIFVLNDNTGLKLFVFNNLIIVNCYNIRFNFILVLSLLLSWNTYKYFGKDIESESIYNVIVPLHGNVMLLIVFR